MLGPTAGFTPKKGQCLTISLSNAVSRLADLCVRVYTFVLLKCSFKHMPKLRRVFRRVASTRVTRESVTVKGSRQAAFHFISDSKIVLSLNAVVCKILRILHFKKRYLKRDTENRERKKIYTNKSC